MTTTTCDEWRPIAGYEGSYSVDRAGRVRSERRRVPNARRVIPERILTPQSHRGSKVTSVLLSVNNAKRRRYVHRLLAETFPETENR
jgi:hypothetical protein